MSYFATVLKQQRAKLGFTMQALADRAQISKSMICKMERLEVQPTLDVAHRVAEALGLSLSQMLQPAQPVQVTLTQKADQAVWEDETGIKRRTLSPILENLEIDWLQIDLPPKAKFAKRPLNRDLAIAKYFFVTRGSLVVTVVDQDYHLDEGDSLYFSGNHHNVVSNPGRGVTQFFIVVHYING